MFKNARTNSYIYILTKGATPMLETGIVQSVSQPRIGQMNNMPQSNPYQYPQPMVVDMVANVGAERRNLQGLPSDLDIADYNGNIVVTLDKEKIINEVKVLYKREDDIIKDHDNAIKRRDIYSGMLASLNPEEAAKKAQDDKIASLENTVAQLMELNKQQAAQFQQMMSQFNANANNGGNYKQNKTKNNETSQNN